MDHVLLIHEFQVPIYIHGDDAALLFDDKNNGFDIIKRPYKRKDLDIRIIKDQEKFNLEMNLFKLSIHQDILKVLFRFIIL